MDVGHLLIGMDARRSGLLALSPTSVSYGLEAATWAGDLGGGAARLAMRQCRRRGARDRVFRGMITAAPVTLRGTWRVMRWQAAACREALPRTEYSSRRHRRRFIRRLLNGTGSAPSGWNSRCRTFLTAMGGAFDSSGALTNRPTVLAYLTEQIHDFGCWYLVNFQRQHHGMDAAALGAASRHMAGASAEIAELFLGALERCNTNPALALSATGSGPSPSPAGSPSCLLARVVPEGARLINQAREQIEQEVIPEAERVIEAAEEVIEQDDNGSTQRRRPTLVARFYGHEKHDQTVSW